MADQEATTTTPAPALDGRRLYQENSAVRKAGWLPRGLWDELDELAERHESALEEHAAVRQEAHEFGQQMEQEDEALKESYRTGTSAPKVTPQDKRDQIAAQHTAKIAAAAENLYDAIAAAVEGVQRHADEWQHELRQRKRDAEAQVAEAHRMVSEANRALGEAKRTEHWVDRTASNRAAFHYAHSELRISAPETLHDLMEKLYQAAGIPRDERPTKTKEGVSDASE